MSILIKNMEMPSRCEECYFLRDVGDYFFVGCKLNIGLTKNRAYEHRHNRCPLVPVPPHGRLIDADALLKDITPTDEDEDNGAKLLMNVFCQVVKTRPTIIPAEEPFGKSEQLNA